jgi:hypothetical protein
MVDSYPSNTNGTLGWTVTVYNVDAAPDSVQVHAMCITPPVGGLAAATATLRKPRDAAGLALLKRPGR